MPLITSPIDGSPMRQIHRYGVEFDVCPTTGGIWLDKGELEKIIAIIKEESEQLQASYRDGDHDRSGDHDRRYQDDDDFRPQHRGGRRSRLFDLFDF